MYHICEICGKGDEVGRSKSHKRGVAGKRWRKRAPVTSRIFGANLQKKTIVVEGKKKQVLICTKCIKRIKKYGKVKDYSNIAVL